MSRSIFGWSYPPGAANDPNAPWNQEEGPCAVCCKPVDACVCPECPTCGEVGEPACYAVGEHGMKLSREQAIGRQEARLALAQERVNDAMLALDHLRDSGEFSDILADDPDPWG
jgi:hypothetical protein